MAGDGTLFGYRPVTIADVDWIGLGGYNDPSDFLPSEACEFVRWTGYPLTSFGNESVAAFPDITATSGTTLLVSFTNPNGTPSSGTLLGTPRGYKVYITSVNLAVTTAFTGGTAGTVSLSLQSTDGTVIASFTQTALSATGYLSLPTTTLPTGVVDNLISLMGASTAVNQGLQIVASNSTAGVARLRIRGYYGNP